MKNIVIIILSLFVLTILSCSQKTDYGQPSIDINNLENDFNRWWSYQNTNISLSSEFIPIDVNSNRVTKEIFLKNLTSGSFIPLKLNSKDGLTYYKLFRLDRTAVSDIKTTIISTSSHAYDLFKKEGQFFPKFIFTDLKGKTYNNENTKGKIVILKCWFIGCHACILEFPELNNLVEKYQSQNDIVFISLALDQKENLDQFLLIKPFKFAVIPGQKDYINNVLNITEFPTLFIIDKNGVIKKVVNSSSEMISVLEKMISLTHNNEITKQ
jgi:thiol-disulfide isomerase/thioredoxin